MFCISIEIKICRKQNQAGGMGNVSVEVAEAILQEPPSLVLVPDSFGCNLYCQGH